MMPRYIDGFVLPIPKDELSTYQAVAEQVAAIWREHGALDYFEWVGDDLLTKGTPSFVTTSGAKEDEKVVFGWAVFESREARDLANERVAADPRMAQLVEPLTKSPKPIFDPTRMAYGGFRSLV